MKVEIRTICTATVEETWEVDIPDADQMAPERLFERVEGVVKDGEEPGFSTLRHIEDEVDDERDREVTRICWPYGPTIIKREEVYEQHD